MNTQHLKYIVEVAKAGSISLAADKLYMNQPNLSKAIKEIETAIGIDIFRRTPKGIVLTKKGEEFLHYAKNILTQVEQIEAMFKKDKANKITFSLSVPRASYISNALTLFLNRLDPAMDLEIKYKETDSMKTIKNIMEEDYNLGIIRYHQHHENYFLRFIKDRLSYENIWEFEGVILMSKHNPLALSESITDKDLDEYLEITHGDLKVPYLSLNENDMYDTPERKRRINIYERGSQFDLLIDYPNSYMWVSPLPQQQLERHGLVQRRCSLSSPAYKDVMIYRKGYKLSKIERLFIEELQRVRDGLKN